MTCVAFGIDAHCSGEGRPTCTAGECVFGIEACPTCGALRGVGGDCGHPKSLSVLKREAVLRGESPLSVYQHTKHCRLWNGQFGVEYDYVCKCDDPEDS